MLLAEPRALLAKLGVVCTRALERAAGACVTQRHYEVTVEHMLLALLDEPESDLPILLGHFQVEVPRLRSALQRTLEEQRSGNAGKPVFSPILLEWIQDAWLYASIELGDARLRSGALLVRLTQAPVRYLGTTFPVLEALPRDELRKDLATLAASSTETPADEGPGEAGPRGGALGSGEQSALSRFTTNLTERARAGEIDPVVGREPEVRQVVDILCRRRKNNPIIVGEPGVGKTALVEGLALRIAHGDVPEQLRKVQVLVLDLGALQAGAGVRGEFENRLRGVISEVKASPVPIVLFIDEAHTIIGAGGPQGGGDAANLLKPALARGELRTIAATTWAEYKRYFEKDAALERRFQPVKVEEPPLDQAVTMLRGLAARFEDAHGVLIRDQAVRAAVELSNRYVTGRQLPDKAVDLLDTASARVKIMRAATPSALEDARAKLAALDRQLAAMHREELAGHGVDEAARRRTEDERETLRRSAAALEEEADAQRAVLRRIDDLRKQAGRREEIAAALGELDAIPRDKRILRSDVDEEVVASVVADWTGIPVGRMMQDDVRAVAELDVRLQERVRGQEGALSVIARELRAARSGLKAPGPPLGVFLLVGPSGVGKTETALGLADLLFGGERFLVTINMSEFQERHTVSRLIGSPPGYVGYGEGGKLTEAVRQRPYSVVLLDEVEKADREVMNLFYQVFDKGTLNDGEGRTISFSNTVLVMTSNLATDLLTKAAEPGAPLPPYEELIALVKPLLSDYFKPALLARMTVVPYVPIRPEALEGIVATKLAAVSNRARDSHGLSLQVDGAVVSAIASRCREVESGARNIDHILRGSILPLVSKRILDAIAEGVKRTALKLAVDGNGEFVCGWEG
jgi:type VI secretion system protein VasG